MFLNELCLLLRKMEIYFAMYPLFVQFLILYNFTCLYKTQSHFSNRQRQTLRTPITMRTIFRFSSKLTLEKGGIAKITSLFKHYPMKLYIWRGGGGGAIPITPGGGGKLAGGRGIPGGGGGGAMFGLRPSNLNVNWRKNCRASLFQ